MLAPIDFKLADTAPELEFRGLKVWKTDEVCHLGATINPSAPGGRHVTPHEFHALLDEGGDGDAGYVLLDARNLYESRLGRFEAPAAQFYAPPTSTFADLPGFLDRLPEQVGSLKG